MIEAETARLASQPGGDARLATGALRLLKALALAEDAELTALMRNAATAERVYGLFAAAVAAGGASGEAALRAASPARKGAPREAAMGTAAAAEARERLAVARGARAFMEALWASEGGLPAHPLLSDAMRAADPQRRGLPAAAVP